MKLGEGYVSVNAVIMEAGKKRSKGCLSICRSTCDFGLCLSCQHFSFKLKTILNMNYRTHFNFSARRSKISTASGFVWQLTNSMKSLFLWFHSELTEELGFYHQRHQTFFCFISLFSDYPGPNFFFCCHTKRSCMLQAFAEWVTQSTTDCVWSAKWAGDCMAASHRVCQMHVALAEELSFLSS